MIGGAALSVATAGLRRAQAQAGPNPFQPEPGGWRRFQVTTRIEVADPAGRAQAWIPLPSVNEPDWVRPMGSLWSTNAGLASQHRDPRTGTDMLHVIWESGEAKPWVEVESRFATRDRQNL